MSFKSRAPIAAALFSGMLFCYSEELLFEILAFSHLLSVLEVTGHIVRASISLYKKAVILLCYTIAVVPLSASLILLRPTETLLWSSVVINSSNDTMQFLCGQYCPDWILSNKKIGVISPRKTYRGYFLGMLTSAVIAHQLLSMTWGCIFAVLGLSSLGDLTMSSIKRHLRIKHYSMLLGSHGGMTDRADSFLFSVPFLVYHLR